MTDITEKLRAMLDPATPEDHTGEAFRRLAPDLLDYIVTLIEAGNALVGAIKSDREPIKGHCCDDCDEVEANKQSRVSAWRKACEETRHD